MLATDVVVNINTFQLADNSFIPVFFARYPKLPVHQIEIGIFRLGICGIHGKLGTVFCGKLLILLVRRHPSGAERHQRSAAISVPSHKQQASALNLRPYAIIEISAWTERDF
ncbi:PREDICTED: uncharacterized protein LOC108565380 [Nicrophorus vespilloides]|uniref:Uncharacterized protein LOC108565380 n=1 Tax=Nicrophorus vespilloides TaxID=110193 RepID=A0ABM1N0E0_NICVS|nr:PREDICTED: uncharacterized protein LOC108565380 [Nicrophorus vespilloides]